MPDSQKQPDTAKRVTGGEQGDGQPVRNIQLNADAIDRLSHAFETSARRWELIVYPALFAFIILATYGFYLIFSLAKDVHYLAVSVDSNMTVMSSNMQAISDNLGQMRADVGAMTVSVESISQDVGTLEPMLTKMGTIEQAIQSMTLTTANMQESMADMNRSIGRPMSFMNRLMPW